MFTSDRRGVKTTLDLHDDGCVLPRLLTRPLTHVPKFRCLSIPVSTGVVSVMVNEDCFRKPLSDWHPSPPQGPRLRVSTQDSRSHT